MKWIMMNEAIRRKKQEITNKKVYQKYCNLDCVRIQKVKEYADIDRIFIDALYEMRTIEYSKAFSTEFFAKPHEYIDFLYENLHLKNGIIRWLIPCFGGGSEWYDVVVSDVEVFFDNYFENEPFSDFVAVDLENKLIFEIENGEETIDYYIKKY